MAYKKVLDQVLLSDTPKDDVEVFSISPGYPKLGVCLAYEKGAGSTSGKPGFRLYWVIPGVGECLATVRQLTSPTDIGTSEITLREYDGVIVCEDLLGSDGTVFKYRDFELGMGATGVRIEPFEAGDTVHPGKLTVWMGRSAS